MGQCKGELKGKGEETLSSHESLTRRERIKKKKKQNELPMAKEVIVSHKRYW